MREVRSRRFRMQAVILCAVVLLGNSSAELFNGGEVNAAEAGNKGTLWENVLEAQSGESSDLLEGANTQDGWLSEISGTVSGNGEEASSSADDPVTNAAEETPATDAAAASETSAAEETPATDAAEETPATDAAEETPATDAAETSAADTAAADSSTGAQSATVMIYMNGSDLESQDGAATADISEMLRAGCGENVNVVIETLGTRKWQGYGISGDTAQRWRVNGSELELVQDNLGQLDSTVEGTLSDFISWAATDYPADRYILLFWDHGGGAVYGYGYDEWQSESDALTMDEIRNVLQEHQDTHFDFIGMDACLMSSLEVCLILAPYCNYSVLSEDFESGIGWYYTDWLKALEENPGISCVELGKVIVDTMLAANKADKQGGGDATLAVIDESHIESLFQAWINFAYANESLLLGNNYSTKRRSKGRVLPSLANVSAPQDRLLRYDGGYFYEEDDIDVSEYYVTDIMAVAANSSGEGAAELETAVSNAIAYMDSSSSESLTGIGVTLPYGDSVFYSELQKIFTNCALDSDYIIWLQKFVSAQGSGSFYDYGSWYENWEGWSGWYSQMQNAAQGGSGQAGSGPDDGYYEDDPDGGGYYDDSGYNDEGYFESLYNCYGASSEPYDEWYDEWYSGWEECGECEY